MRAKGTWQDHEYDIAKILGLDLTTASGNKFYDPGDSVSRGDHPSDNDFMLITDAKFTTKGSYSVNAKFLKDWVSTAQMLGRRFILPLRFWKDGEADDYIILPLNDYVELLECYRGHSAKNA